MSDYVPVQIEEHHLVTDALLQHLEDGVDVADQLARDALDLLATKADKAITLSNQTGTSYTLDLDDAGTLVQRDVASSNTVTVPPNSAVAFPVGTFVWVWQRGAGATTIAAGSGVTIRCRLSLTSAGQYAMLYLRKRAADVWVLSGDLAEP